MRDLFDAPGHRRHFALGHRGAVGVESGQQHVGVGHEHRMCRHRLPAAPLHAASPLQVREAAVVAAREHKEVEQALGMLYPGFADIRSDHLGHAPAVNGHHPDDAAIVGTGLLREPVAAEHSCLLAEDGGQLVGHAPAVARACETDDHRMVTCVAPKPYSWNDASCTSWPL